nr:hypothetical protein [uncultured Dyadobacter sp.]
MSWLTEDIDIVLMAAFAITFLLLFIKNIAAFVIRKPIPGLKRIWTRQSKNHP